MAQGDSYPPKGSLIVGTKSVGFCGQSSDWVPSLNAYLTLNSTNLILWQINQNDLTVSVRKITPIPDPDTFVAYCLAINDNLRYAFVVGITVNGEITPTILQYEYDNQGTMRQIQMVYQSNAPGEISVCLGQPSATSSALYSQFTWGANPAPVSPGNIASYH